MTNSPPLLFITDLFIASVMETDRTDKRWRFPVNLIHHIGTEGTIILQKTPKDWHLQIPFSEIKMLLTLFCNSSNWVDLYVDNLILLL